MSGRWLQRRRGLRHADHPITGLWPDCLASGRSGSTWGPRAVSPRPAGLLGLGYWVAHHQPGPHRARDLRRGAGSCQGERGALGERGELRGEGLEVLRQGRGYDDEVRVPGVDRPGQLLARGVHPEIVDPPPAAVQDDAEDHQRQVVKLAGGAGQDGAGAVPVPPAPGQPGEPPADEVAGEVLLGDAGRSALPALPEFGEIRQHHVTAVPVLLLGVLVTGGGQTWMLRTFPAPWDTCLAAARCRWGCFRRSASVRSFPASWPGAR